MLKNFTMLLTTFYETVSHSLLFQQAQDNIVYTLCRSNSTYQMALMDLLVPTWYYTPIPFLETNVA